MVIKCDLESPTICREGRVCANVSTHIDAKFRTSCIGSTSLLENASCILGDDSCCAEGFVCREVFFEGQPLECKR